MNLDSLLSADIQSLLLKGFMVVFSIIYMVYAIIVLKQTRVMVATVEDVNGGIFLLISFIQLIVTFVLVFIAFVLM